MKERKKQMKFWTDYPFESLGDAPYKEAPIRQIDVLSYDNDKYCKIKVEGVNEEIKAGYIYQKEGRFGEVPVISQNQLKQLSIEFELERETLCKLKTTTRIVTSEPTQ